MRPQAPSRQHRRDPCVPPTRFRLGRGLDAVSGSGPRGTGPAGVTLVEMLMTITILGLLASVLLPAIGMARESARRSACANNLSQLARAAITHDTDLGRLPGWRNSVSGYSAATTNAVSWTVSILPFIGEKDLSSWYHDYTTGVPQDDVTQKQVSAYICPSAENAARAAISYAGNGGTGAETLEAGSPKLQFSGDGAMLDAVGNGSFAKNGDYAPGTIGLDDIQDGDGVSGTLLLIERCGTAAPATNWTANPLPAAAGVHSFATTHAVLLPPAIGGAPPTNRRFINPTASTIPVAGDLLWASRYPSSPHKGVATAAFADGHVRVLSEKIDVWVCCQLMSSIAARRSPRAIAWEHVGGSTVPYLLDDADLAK